MTFCNIHFKVYFHTNYSENVAILGNLESLGCWDSRKPLYLKTNQSLYPYWETEDPIKVPSGAKLEFKFAVFRDSYLVRWENLPNCENRAYRPRYFAVTLDCVDSRLELSESINKRFISSASLENLDEYKKVKKDKKGFNPFIDARGSMSSDSYDGSSRVLSEDMDSFILLEASPFRSDEHGDDSIIESEKPKGSSFKESLDNRKTLLRGHAGVTRMSGLEKVISFDERRPDVLSMLYHQHRKQKSIPKNKPSCLVNCESEDEGCSLELENETAELSERDQVVYTSFRLPISVSMENPEGSSASEKWKVTINNSHLGSIYRIFRTYVKETIWIGWIGSAIEQRYQEELTGYLFREYSCIPIFLESESFSQFLNEYCNQFLHDAFFNGLDMKTVFSQEAFITTYEKINKYFADKVLQYATVNTLIVVQDYHLMTLPKYLGLNNPKFTIAYVFETPFLTPEILKAFQNKNQILESILSCDLICFNISEYLKMLANISSKIMNIHLSCERGGHMYLKNGGRKVYTRVASPSIDPNHVDKILKSHTYEQVKREIRGVYDSKTLMLGIAHLEKTEGIANLLQAIKLLFESDKNQAYQFCILQCEDAYKYGNDAEANSYKVQMQNEIRAINEMMSRKGIRSQIEIIDGVISEEKKFALMELSKLLVAFSPYLDNDLHILEYLFTKKESPGNIILSEFAHGHKHLNSLIKVNPFNKTEIIDGIKMGLARRNETITHLLELDRESISAYTAWDRVHSLLSDLKKIQSIKSKLNLVASEEDNIFKVLALKDDFRLLDQGKLLCDFKKAKKRVIIISYEETLVPEYLEHKRNVFEEIDPQTLHSMSEDNKDVIRGLTFCNDTYVYIVSKRQAETLAREFNSIARATLLAENGFSYRMPRESKWFNIFQCDWSWKSIVHRIMNNYANRTEGVQVSTNESSIVWNHGDVRPEIAKIQETALINHLMTVLTHVKNLEILKEREDIEVKPAGISKGITCELIVDKYKILEGSYPDFVLCIGGSSKDEEMFSKIEEIAKNNDFENGAWYTCTVQRKPSHAKYFVKGIPEMYEVLRTLAENG